MCVEVFLGDPESFVAAAERVFLELEGSPEFERSLVRLVGVVDQLGAHWGGWVSREVLGAQVLVALLAEGVDPVLGVLVVHRVFGS